MEVKMKSRYHKNIILLYAFSFFDGFIMAYVIERLFWAKRGMSVNMVVSTEILYCIIVVLLEVPSGILADIFGRKKMLLMAGFFSVIELVIIYFAYSYAMFAIAIVFAGISNAAESGSMQALMYDSLAMEKREFDFEATYGKFHVFDTMSSSLAALCGGITAYYVGLEANYVVSIGSKIMAFVLLMFLTEAPRQALQEVKISINSFGVYLKEGTKFFRNHHVLFCYCVNGMVLGACWNYIDEFWQLLMQAVKVPVIFFGGISILYSVFTIPGNLLVNHLKKRLSYPVFFTTIPFIYGSCFLVITFMDSYMVLLPLMYMGIWHGILQPLLDGAVLHKAESAVRATVESMVSFIMRFVSIGVGLLFSLFADRSIFQGFGSLGMICFVYGMINFIWIRRSA
jgi:MFS family permease